MSVGLALPVAGDDIAVGSVADRCLLSGVIQTSHFKGVRTVFDPEQTSRASSVSGWSGQFADKPERDSSLMSYGLDERKNLRSCRCDRRP